MIDLKQYRENARQNNLCTEYTEKWDSCHSNKQIMDMALGVKAVDFLCDSIAKGWGLSPEYISERFKNFINGKYTSEQNGYTSKMYCEYEGVISADTTMVCLIDSKVTIKKDKSTPICEMYCTGKCEIDIQCVGLFVFVCYGDPDNIIITGNTSGIKRINKKERDHYE